VKEPAFSDSQLYVLFLLWFSVGLWFTEAVPPFAVGFFIMAYLAYALGTGLFTDSPQDVRIYLNTFSSPVIWLMMGGFLLASAMTKTKLDADLVRITMRVCGTDPKRVLFGLMTITMVFSMLISNTPPRDGHRGADAGLVSSARESKCAKALVLGIPIAASTGGMGTIIGSPPNAVAAGILAESGSPMGFLRWIVYGLPLAVFLTLLAWRVLVRLYMKETAPLSIEDPPAGETIEPGFRAKRMTVLVVVLVTVSLWLEPAPPPGAAAVAAVPLVFLPMSRILQRKTSARSGGTRSSSLQEVSQAGAPADGSLESVRRPDRHTGGDRRRVVRAPRVRDDALLQRDEQHATSGPHPTRAGDLPGHATEVCLIIGLSASTALFLPVSTPPNASPTARD
jgi:sodium-dependent dicarboxylate transporter 2/3/5